MKNVAINSVSSAYIESTDYWIEGIQNALYIFFLSFSSSYFIVYCGSKNGGVFQGAIDGASLFIFRRLDLFSPFRPIPFFIDAMSSFVSPRWEAGSQYSFW